MEIKSRPVKPPADTEQVYWYHHPYYVFYFGKIKNTDILTAIFRVRVIIELPPSHLVKHTSRARKLIVLKVLKYAWSSMGAECFYLNVSMLGFNEPNCTASPDSNRMSLSKFWANVEQTFCEALSKFEQNVSKISYIWYVWAYGLFPQNFLKPMSVKGSTV